jgi:hypothetical protein
MHVEQFGSTLFVSNPHGWDMDGGTLLLSLAESKKLRDALDAVTVVKQSEGGEDNGEDG